jgi:hypothetical protein
LKVWCNFPRAWSAYGLGTRLELRLEPDATVGVLLEVLRAHADPRLRSLLIDSDGQPKVLICLAGETLAASARLQDGQELQFIVPIAGGAA